MRVAVVGAGYAGLVTAKVLSRTGHEVVVYERTADVGGVWSAERRYPGVSTQSVRDTYAFTDHPMPSHYPQWPTGEQVQAYLESYAARFGVDALLRLRTEVVTAQPRDGGGWELVLREVDGDGRSTEAFDHLVVANGVFNQPEVPAYDGEAEFAAAGGVKVAGAQFHDLESAFGARAVVVGYGKTSCDVATEISRVAARTDLVARQLLWKVPRRIAGVVNFKHLLLTRLGEALFGWQERRGVERFLHGPGNGLRRSMLNSLGSVSVRQHHLDRLGLVPGGAMEDIVKGAIGLTTDGFYEQVRDGAITVHRDRTVRRLLAEGGTPTAELSDGTRLPADLLVCATGYRQSVPFLPPAVHAGLLDERGSFMLYRHVLPLAAHDLSFAGYSSSFFSPLNAEAGALWLAAHLAGRVALPGAAAMRAQVEGRLAFLDRVTGGHHAHGTKIIPFSLRVVDEQLADIGVDVSRAVRLRQWLSPVMPSSYAGVTRQVERALAPSRPGAPRPRPVPAA